MGTNYYARIIPKEEDKQLLKEAIDTNDYDTIKGMVADMYHSLDEYTHKGGEIHLGKSSDGWKFLWNSNIHEYCDGRFDKDNHFIPVYKQWSPYELTKEGITRFVMRPDIEIYDEDGELQDKKEFLDFAFNKEGIDGKEYQTNPKYNAGIYWRESAESLRKFTSLGFKPEYGEFYSDGLRFSTSINFS